MLTRKLSLLLPGLLLAGVAHAQSAPPVVTSNSNSAHVAIAVARAVDVPSLITDQRVVTLAAGRNLVRFFGVPATLDDDSVQLRVESRDQNAGVAEVLQQRFRPVTKATQKALLDRAIGQTVTVLREQNAPPLKGTLLATAGAILLDTPDGIVVNPQGTFVLPHSDAQNGARESFTTAPVLEWVINAPAAGSYALKVRYAMVGLCAAVSYQAAFTEITGESGTFALQGWLTLINAGALAFHDADIALPGMGDFPVARHVGMEIGEKKKLSFVLTRGVPATREWQFSVSSDANFLKPVIEQPADVVVRIANEKANGLGVDLPSGTLTFAVNYRGELLDTIEQDISYIGSGAKLQLHLRPDHSYTVWREIVRSRQLNPVTKEHTIRFTVKNKSTTAKAVKLMDRLPSGAQMTEARVDGASVELPRAENGVIAIPLTIPARGQTIFEYVVEVKS